MPEGAVAPVGANNDNNNNNNAQRRQGGGGWIGAIARSMMLYWLFSAFQTGALQRAFENLTGQAPTSSPANGQGEADNQKITATEGGDAIPAATTTPFGTPSTLSNNPYFTDIVAKLYTQQNTGGRRPISAWPVDVPCIMEVYLNELSEEEFRKQYTVSSLALLQSEESSSSDVRLGDAIVLPEAAQTLKPVASFTTRYSDAAESLSQNVSMDLLKCAVLNCTLWSHTVLRIASDGGKVTHHPTSIMSSPLVEFHWENKWKKRQRLFGSSDDGDQSEGESHSDEVINEEEAATDSPAVNVSESLQKEIDAIESSASEADLAAKQGNGTLEGGRRRNIAHLTTQLNYNFVPEFSSAGFGALSSIPDPVRPHLRFLDLEESHNQHHIIEHEPVVYHNFFWSLIETKHRFNASTAPWKPEDDFYLADDANSGGKEDNDTATPLTATELGKKKKSDSFSGSFIVAGVKGVGALITHGYEQGVRLYNRTVLGLVDNTTESQATPDADSPATPARVIIPGAEVAKNVTFQITCEPISLLKFVFLTQMDASFQMQQQWGMMQTGSREKDQIKRIFLENNPYFLGLTMLVSVLHMFFEYLAFSNDVKFWRGKKNLHGLSLRTVAVNCYFQVIIFLYLLDGEETSWTILIPAGFGLLIEFWKLKKVIRVVPRKSGEKIESTNKKDEKTENSTDEKASVKKKDSDQDKEEKDEAEKKKENNSSDNETQNEQGEKADEEVADAKTKTDQANDNKVKGRLTRLFLEHPWSPFHYYSLEWNQDELDETQKFDREAVNKVMCVLGPMLILYSLYSMCYDEHAGWWSFIIRVQVRFIYFTGFAMMTPQIFINYKLKSVAHMPWRAFVYKSLNTFVDDLFAFIVTMPTMHRMAAFRDDVIFFILLYQRWIYPVDKKRVNEFGQGGEDGQAGSEQQAIENGTGAATAAAAITAAEPQTNEETSAATEEGITQNEEQKPQQQQEPEQQQQEPEQQQPNQQQPQQNGLGMLPGLLLGNLAILYYFFNNNSA